MDHVATIPLPVEGVNIVEVPEDGEIIGVVIGPGFDPALAVFGDRDARKETRRVYVTRAYIEEDVAVGEYLGNCQPPGRAAMHVFEVEAPKAKK